MWLEVHNNRRFPEGKIKELECASESSVIGVGSSPSPPQSMGVLSNSPVRGRGLGEGDCSAPQPGPLPQCRLLCWSSIPWGEGEDATHARFVLCQLVSANGLARVANVPGASRRSLPRSCNSCRTQVPKRAAMSYLCRSTRCVRKSFRNALARIWCIGQKSSSVEEISTSPRIFWKWQWVLPHPFGRSSPSLGSARF